MCLSSRFCEVAAELVRSQTSEKYFESVGCIIAIIIRSRRQQRSVASTQSGHDDEPWTIRHECWRCVPSPICWIHEWRGRPGRRRQPGPKRGLVLAAATCDNAPWAGVWSSSLTTWLNKGYTHCRNTSNLYVGLGARSQSLHTRRHQMKVDCARCIAFESRHCLPQRRWLRNLSPQRDELPRHHLRASDTSAPATVSSEPVSGIGASVVSARTVFCVQKPRRRLQKSTRLPRYCIYNVHCLRQGGYVFIRVS